MRKIIAGALLLCLLLAGCGSGAEDTQSAAVTPTMTAMSTATTTPTATATPTPTKTAQPTPGTTGEAELSVMFINVGYGDATLVQVNGKSYLIDAGPKEAVVALYRALALCGVNRLDGLFLTHTHNDHVGGAEALALRCDIGTLYSAEISMKRNVIEGLAEDLSLAHQTLSAGDTIDIGGGAYFEVLGPVEYNLGDNDNSLVMKLHAGGVTVLLTGDMQNAEEKTLLDAGIDVTADVLKVGNHGNPDATSEAFAQAVGAQIAVISTNTAEDGDSPADRVIAALEGAQVYVTQDYACGVLLTVTGGEIDISGLMPPEAAADIAIQEIDRDAQTITLVNHGADAELSGYFIISQKGGEIFVFPQGAVIAAGETLTVACRGGAGDYIWDEKKVWSDKNGEEGVLYDAYGNELSRLA